MPSIRISPGQPRSTPKKRQQQFALALPVEAAEADDLAGPDRQRDVAQPVGPGQVAASSTGAALGSARAPASAERRGCIRARSSARPLRCRSSCRPRSWRRCGRCGTPCTRRRARRSRACGARCRAAPALPSAAASARAKILATSAAVSAEVASSRIRMRGLRASALAISTIWRRDSGRSLTSASGWMSSAPARASASSAIRRCALRSIMPNRVGGSEMTMLSATLRSGISDSSWKMQTMPACVGRGRRGEGDLAAVERHAAFVGRDDAGHDLDQGRFAGAVFAEDGVDAPGVTDKLGLLQRPHAAIALRDALHAEERNRSPSIGPSRGRLRLIQVAGAAGSPRGACAELRPSLLVFLGLAHDFLRGEIDAAGREGVADEEVVGLVGEDSPGLP